MRKHTRKGKRKNTGREPTEAKIIDLVNESRDPTQAIALDLTQTSNGRLLAAMFRSQVRYCHPQKKWFIWDGARWREDTAGVMARAAKQVVEKLRELAAQEQDAGRRAQILRWAHRCQSAAQQDAMLRLARSEPGIPIHPEDFDRDPWLLGLPNGTLDLRTRTFRPSRPEDYMTKRCGVAYDAKARCPSWEAFLKTVLPSPAVRRYLQKVLGISLTGDTSDQGFYILYGTGANGKTTLIETYAAVLGDYAADTPTATLLSRVRDGGVPNDLARLKGARFVYAAEPDVSKKLAEELLKRMTGGDPITARFLFAEFFTFWPEFKLFLLANHKPQIEGREYATWRRVHLIPFTETIPEAKREKHFKERKLMPELAGILNWALDGLAAWEEEGLVVPDEIREATEQYRQEMDEVGDFFENCVEAAPGSTLPKCHLYEHFAWYYEGEPPLKKKTFGSRVKERGIKDGSTGHFRVWKDIRLKTRRTDGTDG